MSIELLTFSEFIPSLLFKVLGNIGVDEDS